MDTVEKSVDACRGPGTGGKPRGKWPQVPAMTGLTCGLLPAMREP